MSQLNAETFKTPNTNTNTDANSIDAIKTYKGKVYYVKKCYICKTIAMPQSLC